MAPAPLPVQPAPLEDDLVDRWTGFAYAIADDYFLPGGDRSDLRQEALIGLVKGLRTYDPSRGSLKSFLWLTIKSEVQTALTAARRQRHRLLNEACRDVVNDDGELVHVLDVVADPGADLYERLVLRLEFAEFVRSTRLLSPLERRALLHVIDGVPYSVGYEKDKTIDNALQRAKQKLRAAA